MRLIWVRVNEEGELGDSEVTAIAGDLDATVRGQRFIGIVGNGDPDLATVFHGAVNLLFEHQALDPDEDCSEEAKCAEDKEGGSGSAHDNRRGGSGDESGTEETKATCDFSSEVHGAIAEALEEAHGRHVHEPDDHTTPAVLTHPVLTSVVLNGDLGGLETLKGSEGGNHAVHVAIHRERFYNGFAVGLESAVVIVKGDSDDAAEHRIEDAAW